MTTPAQSSRPMAAARPHLSIGAIGARWIENGMILPASDSERMAEALRKAGAIGDDIAAGYFPKPDPLREAAPALLSALVKLSDAVRLQYVPPGLWEEVYCAIRAAKGQ